MTTLASNLNSLGISFATESERRRERLSERFQDMSQSPGESAIFDITPESRVSSRLIMEIELLKAGKEDETVPTDFAYKTACAVIQSAYAPARLRRNVPRIMPEPWVTTDDVGGIRVLWDSGSRKLRANFGARPELQTYLYHESDVEHDAEPLDATSLKSRLSWLTER